MVYLPTGFRSSSQMDDEVPGARETKARHVAFGDRVSVHVVADRTTNQSPFIYNAFLKYDNSVNRFQASCGAEPCLEQKVAGIRQKIFMGKKTGTITKLVGIAELRGPIDLGEPQ